MKKTTTKKTKATLEVELWEKENTIATLNQHLDTTIKNLFDEKRNHEMTQNIAVSLAYEIEKAKTPKAIKVFGITIGKVVH